VIGVKVKEYRSGKYIGETLRDYQFNVRKCKFDIIANFTTPQEKEPLPLYYCNDSVFFANTSFNAENYFWDFGDPSTNGDTSREFNPSWVYPGDGDYNVTLRVSNKSCEDTIDITVKIRENVVVDIGPDKIVCDQISNDIIVNDLKATRIEWSTGDTGESITAKDTGLYTVKVFYGQCFGTDSVRITSESVSFSLPSDTTFCESVNHVLDAVTEGPYVKYQWSTGATDTFRTKRVQNEGTYWVKVSNQHCTHIDTVKIGRVELPQSKLLDQYSLCANKPLLLDVGIEGYTYEWNPPNENSSKIFVEKEGIYKVKITDEHGCFIQDSAEVILNLSLYEFFIPNVFTPNADPYNEHYFIDFTGYKIVYFNIYNRWGEKMYEAKGGNVDWDGYAKSREAPEGTYYSVAKVEDNCGQTRLFHGTITLIR
jgi:gliding motility-associated-like protein